MGLHRRIVAVGFRILGLLLGIPAFAALAGLTYSAIDLGSLPIPPPDNSAYLDVGTYGLVGLLSNGAKAVGTGLGKLLALLSGAATWVVVSLAIALLLTLLFAVLLFFVGRGIGRHAKWARIVGMLLAAGFILAPIGVLAVLPRDLMLLACLPFGLSFYTLWVLGWKFEPGSR